MFIPPVVIIASDTSPDENDRHKKSDFVHGFSIFIHDGKEESRFEDDIGIYRKFTDVLMTYGGKSEGTL